MSGRVLLYLSAMVIIVLLVAGIVFFSQSSHHSASEGGAIPDNLSSNVVDTSPATQVVAPHPSFVSEPPAIPKASTTGQPEAEWRIYKDEKYKFGIRYPKEGWGLMTKNGSPALPYSPVREPTNLYTQRAVPTQGPVSAPITISIYEKPSIPIIQWLSAGYSTDFSSVQRGGIETTLVRAYGEETGILSYNEFKKDGISVYEVGGAWTNKYALTYAIFFIKDNSPYVYEINFELPYYGLRFKANPSDSEYIEIFKKIVSTFDFTD